MVRWLPAPNAFRISLGCPADFSLGICSQLSDVVSHVDRRLCGRAGAVIKDRVQSVSSLAITVKRYSEHKGGIRLLQFMACGHKMEFRTRSYPTVANHDDMSILPIVSGR